MLFNKDKFPHKPQYLKLTIVCFTQTVLFIHHENHFSEVQFFIPIRPGTAMLIWKENECSLSNNASDAAWRKNARHFSTEE